MLAHCLLATIVVIHSTASGDDGDKCKLVGYFKGTNALSQMSLNECISSCKENADCKGVTHKNNECLVFLSIQELIPMRYDSDYNSQFKCCITNKCKKGDYCEGEPDDEYCGEKCMMNGHFYCHENNDCYSLDFRCNGERNCKDGADEENCEDYCTGKHANDLFYCYATRQCIAEHLRCDKDSDCGYGDDEQNCGSDIHNVDCKACHQHIPNDLRYCGDKHGDPDADDNTSEAFKKCANKLNKGYEELKKCCEGYPDICWTDEDRKLSFYSKFGVKPYRCDFW